MGRRTGDRVSGAGAFGREEQLRGAGATGVSEASPWARGVRGGGVSAGWRGPARCLQLPFNLVGWPCRVSGVKQGCGDY